MHLSDGRHIVKGLLAKVTFTQILAKYWDFFIFEPY